MTFEDPQLKAIRESKLTIYDSLASNPQLWLGLDKLELLLDRKLKGTLLDQPIRTRSKVIKSRIAEALGYPVPRSFRKTQPRFPGQDFDVYVQKSNNLQIWNEALSATRRYVLVRVDDQDRVTRVKVVNGQQLAKLDTTGTLTQKYQAAAYDDVNCSALVSPNDTPDMMYLMQEDQTPFIKNLLPIDLLFVSLIRLLGTQIANPGADQERNRGWALHRAVSRQLGLHRPHDDGQVPDVAPQLLELKLQTSPTVDLGLASPNSLTPLDRYPGIRLADVRYGIYYGTALENQIRLDHLVLTTGADFFCFFKRLEGNVVNVKNQIRLPAGFFDE